MAYYYIKLYHEMLHDPKVGRLPDRLWRRFVELCLLAGETDQDGALPDIETIAWNLHLTDDELAADLQELEDIGLVTNDGDGHLVVTNFSKRQSRVSSAERVARYRERQAREQYYSDDEPDDEDETPPDDDGNDDVTKRYTDGNESLPNIKHKIKHNREQTESITSTSMGANAPDAAAGHRLLSDFGVHEPNATRYATVPPAWISAYIAMVRAKTDIQNPQGYLLSLLSSGKPPPARASPDDSRRFVEGEYAEYVEH